MDADFGECLAFLERNRAEIAERLVAAMQIGIEFHAFDRVSRRLVAHSVGIAREALRFQRREKPLHRRMIPDIAGLAVVGTKWRLNRSSRASRRNVSGVTFM